MRDLGQPETPPQLGQVGQQRDEAAIVGAEELLERQQGEQLRLREVASREARRISRQPAPRDPQRDPRQRHRRPRHAAASVCGHAQQNDRREPGT